MIPPSFTLAVHDLAKEYVTAAGILAVLKGVNLQLGAGEALAVTGPSGSGKSSLLFVLGAMERPTRGHVQLQGQDVFSLTESKLATLRQQRIGFVFQEHHLLPQCTVLENVLIPQLAGAGTTPGDVERAGDLLRRVGLQDRRDHRPAQLSGGERQRVAVCRALINQPALLLADEPTGNLDRANADAIGTLLLELSRDAGSALICVTHSADLAARFSRRAELRDGVLHEATSSRRD
ncbi:MAG TPA: ABC transporter ATP-binding protein [Planctomycetaceae bacterium]|nr:ABC transporter ATP-binding protein [Planctomycetaceae bacterium]